MIDSYYKNFKIRDYMDENSLKDCLSKKVLDCSLGTNPFIDEKIIKKCNRECLWRN